MPMMTDCARRGVKTRGCDCDFCQGATVTRDGEAVHVSMMFMDSTQVAIKAHSDGARQVADGWPKRVFDAAGVAIREDALSPHERAMRGDPRSPEERERDRRQQAEAEQQARTANRTARGSDSAWDKALAKLHSGGGGVREAGFTRI